MEHHAQAQMAAPNRIVPAAVYPAKKISIPVCAHSAAATEIRGLDLGKSGSTSGRSERRTESSGWRSRGTEYRMDAVSAIAKAATAANVQAELARINKAKDAEQFEAREVRTSSEWESR